MNNYTRHPEKSDLSGKFRAPAQKILTVDVQKYQSWLDEPDLNQEEKEEYLQALWVIIVNFVDMGFGIHPLQEICGKADLADDERPKEAFDRVKSPEPGD